MDPLMIRLAAETDTAAFAEQLARLISIHKYHNFKLYLSGELGAGKTTFSQYFLKALGVQDGIKSPTYTIIESYAVDAMEIDHIDLYRIQEEDLYDLGFLEEDHKLWLIEWPEKGGESLPEPDLLLVLTREIDLIVKLLPKTALGQQVISELNI